MYTIKIICAWCKAVLGETESNHPGDTHTICEKCDRALDAEIEKLKNEPIPFDGRPMPGPPAASEWQEYF